MDRRRFLKSAAATTAALHCFPTLGRGSEREGAVLDPRATSETGLTRQTPDIGGHTPICEFQLDSTHWKVY